MNTRSSADRVLDAYYADVRNSDLLTSDEEHALFELYRTCSKCSYNFRVNTTHIRCPECGSLRNTVARDRLIKSILLFVVKLARDYVKRVRSTHYSNDDDLLKLLVSAGNLGVLTALERFEPSRQTRFLTYAAFWIREKIFEELDNMGLVRVPAYRLKAFRARNKRGDKPAYDAHVAIEDVTVIDLQCKDDRLERDFLNTYGLSVIHRALASLGFKGREKYIVLAYFGVREEPKNLRQISNRLGLSSERVRQIKRDVLDGLRTHLQTQSICVTNDLFTE